MTLIDKAEAHDDDLIRRGDADAAIVACKGNGATRQNCRDAIAAIPARGVGVKPLVWEDFDGLGAKASAFYQANYLIQWWKGEGRYEVALSYPGYQTGYDGDRWHDTLTAAKAAAQADYEARILAALAPTDYTLAPHLQKIVDGAKTAPQWDMQADRLAPTDAPDTDLLFDAYKGMLVLHRTLDRMGLARGSATASRIADKIVAAHPEFPARTALRHTEEPK